MSTLSQTYVEPLNKDLKSMLNTLTDAITEVNSLRTELADIRQRLDADDPIGTIITTTSSINPGTYKNGTWERYGEGRVLVGVTSTDSDFNAPNKTGGAKTHTLTTDEMPSHQHKFNMEAVGAAYVSGTARNVISGSALKGSVTASGGGDPHNNMQPYITVYMWRRTA